MSICEETILALQQLHDLEDEIAKLRPKPEHKAAVEALRAKMVPTILGHHDRMRARGKRSISEVRNNVCSSCHMMVAVGVVNVLRRGEDIQICSNCGRYLFIKPEAPAPAPSPETAPAAKTPKIKRIRKIKSDSTPAA